MDCRDEIDAINEALLNGTLGLAESGLAVAGEHDTPDHNYDQLPHATGWFPMTFSGPQEVAIADLLNARGADIQPGKVVLRGVFEFSSRSEESRVFSWGESSYVTPPGGGNYYVPEQFETDDHGRFVFGIDDAMVSAAQFHLESYTMMVSAATNWRHVIVSSLVPLASEPDAHVREFERPVPSERYPSLAYDRRSGAMVPARAM